MTMIKIGGLLYSTNNGNVTNVRILDITDPIKIEVSFIEKGILNETIEVTNQGTYIETYLSNSTIRGEGKGIIAAQNGEIVTWQDYDSGQLLNSNESQIYNGIIFFNSHSPGKLSFLDNQVGLYIIEIGDDDGSYSRHIWEWK